MWKAEREKRGKCERKGCKNEKTKTKLRVKRLN
jgi:hypothetical protein